MDHFGFSFITAKSIVKGPDPNVFKATALVSEPLHPSR